MSEVRYNFLLGTVLYLSFTYTIPAVKRSLALVGSKNAAEHFFLF